MDKDIFILIISCLAALLISTISSYLLITVADKLHLIASPTQNRWHKRPTPLLGGVAMYVAFLSGSLLYYTWVKLSGDMSPKHLDLLFSQMSIILGSATAMFLLGLIDDYIDIKAYSKFIWQIVIAVIVTVLGVKIEIIQNDFISIPLTVIWIVGITNAINLLDNMDGLAAGVVLVASISFSFLVISARAPFLQPASLILAASALGFLIFNFHPAKMFMGDAGSLLLGFLVSIFALIGTWKTASNAVVTLFAPILILSIPIFDTTLVSINRALSGKKVSEGGRDHSSHRLVAMGLSEKRSVLSLLIMAAIFSALAVVSLKLQSYLLIVVAFLAFVALTLFGIYLSELNVYEKKQRFKIIEDMRRRNRVIDALIIYKKQVFEVLVDTTLFIACYYVAYLIKFDGQLGQEDWLIFLKSLPYVLIGKLAAFALFDPYHSDLKQIGFYELIKLAKAVFAASFFALMCVVFVFKFLHFSRSVFVIDLMLTFLTLAGYRILFRMISEYCYEVSEKSKKILIIGAGSFGISFVRYLRAARSKEYHPVGFLDENKKLRGRRIAGVKVIGHPNDIDHILSTLKVDEVIFMNEGEKAYSLDDLKATCGKHQVEVKRAFSMVRPVKSYQKVVNEN